MSEPRGDFVTLLLAEAYRKDRRRERRQEHLNRLHDMHRQARMVAPNIMRRTNVVIRVEVFVPRRVVFGFALTGSWKNVVCKGWLVSTLTDEAFDNRKVRIVLLPDGSLHFANFADADRPANSSPLRFLCYRQSVERVVDDLQSLANS